MMMSPDADDRQPAPAMRSAFSLLRAVIARLPQYPPSAATALVLNLMLRELLSGPELAPARDKLVRVEITDLGLTLSYRVHSTGVAASTAGTPDVTIAADSAALWALVNGREDADMLFFSRRLVMTGDTELGLFIRNTLDAIDRSRILRLRLPAPAELAGALRNTLDVPHRPVTRAARRHG
jgi:O2-independent ubiquinone biosynthesis accessory factor UbiT